MIREALNSMVEPSLQNKNNKVMLVTVELLAYKISICSSSDSIVCALPI